MSGKKRDRHWSVAIHADIFVLADGVKIAKLGDPGTLQAGTWTPLGWTVRDGPDGLRWSTKAVRGTVH